MHTPASTEPFGALFVGLQAKPVGAGIFVGLHVLKNDSKLLLSSCLLEDWVKCMLFTYLNQ